MSLCITIGKTKRSRSISLKETNPEIQLTVQERRKTSPDVCPAPEHNPRRRLFSKEWNLRHRSTSSRSTVPARTPAALVSARSTAAFRAAIHLRFRS
eukprot:667209-Amphidinium_carterae.2